LETKEFSEVEPKIKNRKSDNALNRIVWDSLFYYSVTQLNKCFRALAGSSLTALTA
jgi:hypothetical protein